MKERKIMEMLSDDISDIELPPISDKVLRALHDKAENKSEKSVHHTASAIKHKHSLLKIVFAAMLAFFVLSVPIIIVITNKDTVVTSSETDRSIVSSKSVIDDESSVVNSYFNPEKKSSALDNIRERKTYGSVCLTSKSSKELESLLLTFNEEMRVYEDDSFIYNFDTEGNLIELLNKTPVDENGIAVSEEEIRNKTQKLISEYYPEWEDTSYEMNVQENRAGRPAWSVDVTKKASVIPEQAIFTYDSYGNIRRIVLPEYRNDTGLISKAEAVQIAMKELKSGKYDIPEFKNEDVEMMVETKKSNGVSYYAVTISNIIVDEKTITVIYFEISSITGEIINVII